MMYLKIITRICVLTALTTGPLNAVNIEVVPVGDRGNTADTRYAHWPNRPPAIGRVDYTYNISKYEVTAGQYTEFLNSVATQDSNRLYTNLMWDGPKACGIKQTGNGWGSSPYRYTVAPELADRPVNYVTFWNACRFANWLHNGQPAGAQGPGTTETGAYTLTTAGIDGNTVTRNTGWKWAIPSEDEWYKAAYYKGGSADAGYWDYPTRINSSYLDGPYPGTDMADVSGNNANYHDMSRGTPSPLPLDPPYYTTIVGEFKNSPGPYGTFDQAGNVTEWTEAVYGDMRGIRGGSFASTDYELHAGGRQFDFAYLATHPSGFRLVQVPEPGCAIAFILGTYLVQPRRRFRSPS